MTKEEFEAFKKELKEDFRAEVKRQNTWIKASTGFNIAFIALLIYLITQISNIKSDYLTKEEYEQKNSELVDEISQKFALNIQLANTRIELLRAYLIEKDKERYKKALIDEERLLEEQSHMTLVINKRNGVVR